MEAVPEPAAAVAGQLADHLMATRGLSRAQAESGYRPPPLIRAEWQMLHAASLVHEADAKYRARMALATLLPVYCDRSLPPSEDE